MSCFVTSTWVTNKCLAVYHVELTLKRLILIKYLKINSTLPKRSVKSIKRLLCKGCPALYSSVDKLTQLLGVKRQTKYKIKNFFFFTAMIHSWNHIIFRFIPFLFALYKLTWDLVSSMPFSLEDKRKRFLFIISPFFVISPEDPIRSSIFHGIICGRLWGSLAVEDHSRSILGITCGLTGITCGTVQCRARLLLRSTFN